jgi:hypothetical protein
MCWRKSYRFWRSTQLSRLVDTYLETLVEQKGVKKIADLKEEEQILHEVYTHSPDMQMLLNLLTEKEGIWSSILILSTFDRNFKNEFKVLLHTFKNAFIIHNKYLIALNEIRDYGHTKTNAKSLILCDPKLNTNPK